MTPRRSGHRALPAGPKSLPKHLQAYLNEFCFRFNRRFWPGTAFDAVPGLGVAQRGPTYRGIYRKTRGHPNRRGGRRL